MDLLRSPLQYSCLENPMDRGAWQLESMVLKKMDMTQQLNNNMLHLSGSKNITMLVQPSSVDFQNAFIIWNRNSGWSVSREEPARTSDPACVVGPSVPFVGRKHSCSDCAGSGQNRLWWVLWPEGRVSQREEAGGGWAQWLREEMRLQGQDRKRGLQDELCLGGRSGSVQWFVGSVEGVKVK